MRKLRKIALIAGVCLVGILVIAWISTRVYLRSNHAKQQVADKLGATLGTRVAVEDLDVGANSVSFRMHVFESADAPSNAPPFLTVERIEADVTPVQLVSGNATPKNLTLRGAKLQLSYNREGKLVTRLPEARGESSGPLPEITLVEGSITINQEGRSPFHLSGVNATLRPDGDNLNLDGTADDPVWKKWTVKGRLNRVDSSFSVTVENPGLHVAQAQLNNLPLVPESMWREVQAEGDTPVRLTLEKSAKGDMNYKVVLKPSSGTIHISSIDLTATNASGEVVIQGARIDVRKAKARTADGELDVDAILDFAPDVPRLQFKVAARGLDITKLPKKWSLPEELEGDLEGSAELELLLHEEEIEPRGQGDGMLENARVAGFPADPIEIHLRPSGAAFKFDSAMQSSRRKRTPRNQPMCDEILVQLLRVTLVGLQPPLVGPEKPARETAYVDARLRLKDVDIKELFTRLKIDLPLNLEARATADITLSIPVTAPRTTAAYRARGTLTVPHLTIEGLVLDDVVAELTLRDGVLTIDKFTAKPRAEQGKAGELVGKARVEIEPRGNLQATLTLTDVPLASALNSIPGLKLDGNGRVSGDATFRAPVEKASDRTTWTASATLRTDKADLQGRRIEELRLEAKLEKGTVELVTAKAKIEGIPITANGTLGLEEPLRFTARVKTEAADTFALRKLLPELELPVAVSGKLASESSLKGTLSPFALTGTGSAQISDAKIADAEVAKASFRWDLDTDRLRLFEVEAKVYDGTISGKATIPLQDKAKGDFDLKFKEVDASALTKAIPELPVTLEGAIDGKLSGTLAPVEKGQPRKATAELELSAPKLELQGIPTKRVTGKLRYGENAIEYALKGDALGGGFEIEGKYPLGSGAPPKQEPEQGSRRFDLEPFPLFDPYSLTTDRLLDEMRVQPKAEGGGVFRLTGADLSRLSGDLKSPFLAPLTGRVDASLTYSHDPRRGLVGSGHVSVRRLAWGSTELSSQLTGILRLNETLLELADATGTFAGGVVRGRVRYNRAQPQRSFFNVLVERADPKVLLAPWPEFAAVVSGSTNVQLRGMIGRGWRGTGEVTLPHGEIGGVAASDLRVPFDWSLSPGRGGHLSARDPSGRFMGGQVVGHANYEWWPGGNRMEGDLRFGGLDLKALDVSQLTGRAKGRFTFSGTDLRSLNDLTGELTATLGDFAPRQSPVMQRVMPYLGTGQSVLPFRSGELRARLSRGAFRVERAELVSPGAQVFAEGTVTLAGRLDLNVTANTGQLGPDDRVIRVLARRIPSSGAVPLTVLKEVNDFMSNRLIRLSVTGTINQPVVRVNKAALLTDEAARFFTQRVREKVLSPESLLVP